MIFIIFLFSFAVACSGLNVFAMGTKPPAGGSFKYDLSMYSQADGEADWREVAKLDVPIKNAAGITVVSNDCIVVACRTQVLIYDSSLSLIAQWPLSAAANCVCVDRLGFFYVGCDKHVDVYSPKGEFEASWTEADEKSIITSVAAIGGMVFVADAGNACVLRYDNKGHLLSRIGGRRGSRKSFIVPSPYMDVVVSRELTLWVVDPGRFLVKNYEKNGRFISSWGKRSHTLEGFSGCCNPVHIAILPDGRFVTAEKGFVRVKIHDQTGKFESLVFPHGHLGKGNKIKDIGVNSKGSVIVLDSKGKLRIFTRKGKNDEK